MSTNTIPYFVNFVQYLKYTDLFSQNKFNILINSILINYRYNFFIIAAIPFQISK